MRAGVSVVVPAYNAQATLTDCLSALRAAMGPDDELILFDDGSTDQTGSIAAAAGARVLNETKPAQGPAHGRNQAARTASRNRLLFVDADVILHNDAVDLLAREMDSGGAVAAFGSYDDRPRSLRATSLYANLRHHFVHQHGQRDATTFWSGIGMIETQAFLDAGGYNHVMFRHPSIEDVDLGMRLKAKGHRISLVPEAQGTHAKDWSLWQVWHTDVMRRALPWSCLIADGAAAPADLNLAKAERRLAILALALPTLLLVAVFWWGAAVAALAAVMLYLFGNRHFFGFLTRRLSPGQLIVAAMMHWCYHMYASITFASVLIATRFGLRRASTRLPVLSLSRNLGEERAWP